MFVFIPGSIPPVRFGPGGTDPAEISIPAVTYIPNQIVVHQKSCESKEYQNYEKPNLKSVKRGILIVFIKMCI